MNVGIFVDAYLPIKNGVVTSVNQLKAGMEAQGHKVYIFTVDVPGCQPLPDVYRVPSIKFGKKSESMFGLVNQKKINQMLVDYKVDLIHTHSEFALGRAGKKAAKALNLPLVHTNHTLWEYYQHYVLGGWLFKVVPVESLIRYLMKSIHYVIAPSVKALDYYKTFAAPDTEFRIIPNGVDQSKFVSNPPTAQELAALRAHYGLTDADRLAIFAGRIGPEKRCIELLTSFVPVLKTDRHLKLMFVGEGISVPTLKKMAQDNGIEAQVLFTGFIDWSQMHTYYGMSHCFVTASVSEVHPMTLIEAAIKGLPGVVKKDAAYQPLLEDGKNGYLVEDDAQIAIQVQQLVHDDKLWQKFSANSLEAVKMYTAAEHVKNVSAYYHHILDDYAQKQNL